MHIFILKMTFDQHYSEPEAIGQTDMKDWSKKMILLTKVREGAQLSKRKLERLSNVCAPYISKAETRGLRLYPVQMERIAKALNWEGNPMELLEEVSEDEQHSAA